MPIQINFDKLNKLAEDEQIKPIVEHVRRLVEKKEEIVWSVEYQFFLLTMNRLSISLKRGTEEILDCWLAAEQAYGEWSIIDSEKVKEWITTIDLAKRLSNANTRHMTRVYHMMLGIEKEMQRVSTIENRTGAYQYKYLLMLHRHMKRVIQALES